MLRLLIVLVLELPPMLHQDNMELDNLNAIASDDENIMDLDPVVSPCRFRLK
jgi:hypothetical protein